MIFPYLLYAVILLSGIPVGYLLAWLCRDELVDGRKYFFIIAILSLILSVITFFIFIPAALTLLFILIVSLISFWKSYDKRLVKK